MNRKNMILVLVAVLLAAFAGCSDQENSSPTATTWRAGSTPVFSTARVVGPSDIVLCLDVSDSISQGELEAQVAGLAQCLGDQSLFPSNGNVGLSIWVYGDTIAAAVEAITAVTPDNITNVFQPALQALLTDRLVTGSSADLAGALTNAQTALGAGVANDRQVLISGSGEAVDAQAARDAAEQLQTAGALVSAIAVDPTVDGAKLLQDCAELGMGIFASSGDYAADCQLVFSWMLVVELTVEPDTAELALGAEHKLEASVYRAENLEEYPEVGLDVAFNVAEGPNAGLTYSAATDTNGVAMWAYTGDGGAGTDIILVSVDQPRTGVALVDTVSVDWLNTAPDCDAGGPYAATVDGDTVVIQLDASASSDADGDTLSFLWSLDCEGASFDDATLPNAMLTLTGDCLCADSLAVQLTVSDGAEETSCEAGITLDDQRPPVIVAGDPYQLWPPNHKYRTITPEMLLESAEDACGNPLDLTDVVIVEVRSDEPDDCTGDGNTVDDILISCPNGLELRAERRGGADGRVYTILYRITDANGAATDVEAQVYVPHDQGKGMIPSAGDDGYTVTPECSDE